MKLKKILSCFVIFLLLFSTVGYAKKITKYDSVDDKKFKNSEKLKLKLYIDGKYKEVVQYNDIQILDYKDFGTITIIEILLDNKPHKLIILTSRLEKIKK